VLAVDSDSVLHAATRPLAGGDWTSLAALHEAQAVSARGGVTAVSMTDLGVVALALRGDGTVGLVAIARRCRLGGPPDTNPTYGDGVAVGSQVVWKGHTPRKLPALVRAERGGPLELHPVTSSGAFGHSLRAGYATPPPQAGIEERQITNVTCYKNLPALRSCIRAATAFGHVGEVLYGLSLAGGHNLQGVDSAVAQ
jgi:hypothetical protein